MTSLGMESIILSVGSPFINFVTNAIKTDKNVVVLRLFKQTKTHIVTTI